MPLSVNEKINMSLDDIIKLQRLKKSSKKKPPYSGGRVQKKERPTHPRRVGKEYQKPPQNRSKSEVREQARRVSIAVEKRRIATYEDLDAHVHRESDANEGWARSIQSLKKSNSKKGRHQMPAKKAAGKSFEDQAFLSIVDKMHLLAFK
ncbi:hypothetical protein QR680_016740 [Steinernema hermaphroditum]|uniref:Uncharacterized protein n=1 Tax=Steinernema hermaphroditum TaxID=289476 RepID=A0AA39HD51_9BILA|nr:hypothetical protein QR680_016740 [Steinernema hermaphroditum]